MNGFRKILFLISAFATVAFVLSSGSAVAADKHYTLTMTPASGTSPIATMTAKFTNAGNSSFNSLTLKVPTNGYSISGTITADRGQVSYSGGVIKILNINLPTGTGQSVTVTMSGVSAAGSTCGTGVSGNWTAVVWTGSSLSGTTFTQDGTSTTNISPSCVTVTAVTSPTTGAHGTISPASQAVTSGASASVTVMADTANHYHVASVTGTADCNGVTLVSGSNWKTGGVTGGACTVTASFAIDQVQVSATATGSGTVAPASQNVDYGSSTTVTVSPDLGYYATATADTCGGSLSGTTYTTGTVTSACTVSATFLRKTLSITSAPANATRGDTFNVVVGLTPGDQNAVVTISSSTCLATATGGTSTGTSATLSVTIPSNAPLGPCTITLSSGDYKTIDVAGLNVSGILDCNNYDSINGKSDHTYDPDLPSTIPGLGSSYVGTAGWGIRRGPNKDLAACIPVNYSCNLDPVKNLASCTFDKSTGQQATFKYLFLWGPRAPDANGWIGYRPQVSWNIASPDMTSANAFMLPDWVPLLSCVSDLFPASPTLPTTILPVIPSVSPFTDAANTHAWYQPMMPNPSPPPATIPQQALVCGAQQGWTSIGSPPNFIQIWDILIDESDIVIKGPG